MYETFVAIHSVFRWLVLLSIMYTIGRSIEGLLSKRAYTKTDNIARTIAGSISHTQLLIGFTLYFVLSPITGYFIKSGSGGNHEIWFFGIYHIAMMFTSIVVMTVGSSIAKRATTDKAKFKTIVIYFSIALLLIFMAIPWFRPFIRNF
ncbi:hypothetical protein [Emticicia sp. 17c]|uniref:hypothetical protein n=1 Tax=Emticicia sp. 17c TaxID=3127704 RepID=UPI00301B9A19